MKKSDLIGIGLVFIYLLICTPFYMLTDSFILAILIGTLVSAGIAAVIWACYTGIDDLKTYKSSETPVEVKKRGIKKLGIAIPSAILMITILVVAFGSIGGSSTHECVRCGKEGNYSNGYCRSCYKGVEDMVRNDYYNYGK